MSGKTARIQRRYPQNDEQRARWNDYQRVYRATHPERVRAWRDRYIVRKAQRLMAERGGDLGGGDDRGGD